MSEKYLNLKKNVFIFGLGTIGSKFIYFLLLPLYTNVLSSEEYGIADLVFSISQFLLPIVSLSISNGLLRYGLNKKFSKKKALKCATVVFVAGSVLTVLLTPLFGLYFPLKSWKWYLCVMIITSSASANLLMYLKVKDCNITYSLLGILQAVFLIICNFIFLVFLHLGIKGYLLSYIVSMSITSVIACMYGNVFRDLRSAEYSSSLLKLMTVYSLPFVFNSLSWWVIHSSDKVMIELMLNESLLGIYTVAAKIPALINAFSYIFNQAWSLSSIREYDTSNEESFYSNVFHFFTVMIFCVCVAVCAVVKPFMSVYVGNDFSDAWQYVPLLLVGSAFYAVSSFIVSLYGAVKQTNGIMTTAIISGVVNIAVNFLLIRVIGLWGAVMGTVAAYAVNMVLRLVEIRKYIKINYKIVKFTAMAVLSVCVAVSVSLDMPFIVRVVMTSVFFVFVSEDLFHFCKTVFKRRGE